MANNYVLLERIELNATAASVTFSNIPQTGYTDLKVVVSIRTDNSDGLCKFYFNADSTASNYSRIRLLGEGGSGTSSSSGSDNNYLFMNASSDTASTFSNGEIYVPNYTSSNQKSISIDTVRENNASYAVDALMAGRWSGTAAITGLTIIANTGNMVSGSTFSLYGVAALGTTPAIAPKADGGNVIATDGTYWYHAFLSNGTFTPQVGLTADVLVVAGGGGGGGAYLGGGGGAGGLRALAAQALAASNYAVTVGSGGPGGTGGTQTKGTTGNPSSINSISTSGGGGGGSYGSAVTGANGGSGGGASSDGAASGGSGNTGGYSPVEGYAGGSTNGAAPYYGAGGGGGAGGVGSNGTGSAGGAGGIGTDTYNSINFSSWLSACSLGVGGKVAGGGGGAAYTSSAGGASNGGGAGSISAGTAGTANTGGGGGGSERTGGTIYNGANGGSGIIIIRYPVAS